MKHASWLAAILLLISCVLLHAGTATVNIDATKPGPRLNPRMYGIFLENLNHAVDDGFWGIGVKEGEKFKLSTVEVSNAGGTPGYPARYHFVYSRLKEQYPKLSYILDYSFLRRN